MAGGFVALAADVLFRLLEPWPVKLVVDAVSRSLGATLRKPGPSLDASVETLLLCGGPLWSSAWSGPWPTTGPRSPSP